MFSLELTSITRRVFYQSSKKAVVVRTFDIGPGLRHH